MGDKKRDSGQMAFLGFRSRAEKREAETQLSSMSRRLSLPFSPATILFPNSLTGIDLSLLFHLTAVSLCLVLPWQHFSLPVSREL